MTCRNGLGTESGTVAWTATEPSVDNDDTGTPSVSLPMPIGFDRQYLVLVSNTDTDGRAVMLFESQHAAGVVPGVADFVIEFLNGEASRIISPPPQADINLAIRPVSPQHVDIIDINFDGSDDVFLKNLDNYIADAIDMAVFSTSTSNAAPRVFKEFDDVLIDFLGAINTYLNNPAPTDAILDAGGVTSTYTRRTAVTNRGRGCVSHIDRPLTDQEIEEYLAEWGDPPLLPISFAEWNTVLEPREISECLTRNGVVVYGDYTVTTTETAFDPVEGLFTVDVLTAVRAMRTAIDNGGFVSGSREARQAEQAFGNVLGIDVGDITGSDIDTRISDPIRLAQVFNSSIYGDLTISEAAQRIANEHTSIGSRRRLFDEYDVNLRTLAGAIDTRFFAAAATVLGRDSIGLSAFPYNLGSFLGDGIDVLTPINFGGLSLDSSKFLRDSSMLLSYANIEMYLRLSRGEELPFARGKGGKELDEAIVEYEQQTLQNIIDGNLIFDGSLLGPDRAQVLKDITASFTSILGNALGDACVREARTDAFPNGGFDFAKKADRIALGKAVVSIERSPAQADCKQD